MKASLLFKSVSAWILAITILVSFQSSAAVANKQDTAESKRYFKQGQSHFEKQEFAQALASFQMAYHYKELPGFFFNMAQCQMELGEHKNALKNYGKYLRAKPGASNIQLVERRISEAKTKLGQLKHKPRKRANTSPNPPAKKVAASKARAKTNARASTKASPKATVANRSNPQSPPTRSIAESNNKKDDSHTTQVATAPANILLALVPPASASIEPHYESWWFWGLTGTFVAATASAIIFATSFSNSDPVVVLPSGSLGRIDRR